jgi:hypothetical protein
MPNLHSIVHLRPAADSRLSTYNAGAKSGQLSYPTIVILKKGSKVSKYFRRWGNNQQRVEFNESLFADE